MPVLEFFGNSALSRAVPKQLRVQSPFLISLPADKLLFLKRLYFAKLSELRRRRVAEARLEEALEDIHAALRIGNFSRIHMFEILSAVNFLACFVGKWQK